MSMMYEPGGGGITCALQGRIGKTSFFFERFGHAMAHHQGKETR
jgi:hypothetical protein